MDDAKYYITIAGGLHGLEFEYSFHIKLIGVGFELSPNFLQKEDYPEVLEKFIDNIPRSGHILYKLSRLPEEVFEKLRQLDVIRSL